MTNLDRYYVEKIRDVSADQKTGIVKLTFSVEGPGAGDVVQLIVSAGNLREIFDKVSETMQKSFAGGPGGPGRRPGGPAANAKFRDLTQE